MSRTHRRLLDFPCFALLATGLAACSSTPPLVHEQERFNAASVYSQTYAASPSATCEAARRALLSQGYVISSAKPDAVEGRKNFQRDSRTHVEIQFHVVCASNGKDGGSIAFANALNDQYALKKSASSASLGVGVLGSFSLPFGSSEDAMVKVASETISARDFYNRFFVLLEHYLDPHADPASVENGASDQVPEKAPQPASRPTAAK